MLRDGTPAEPTRYYHLQTCRSAPFPSGQQRGNTHGPSPTRARGPGSAFVVVRAARSPPLKLRRFQRWLASGEGRESVRINRHVHPRPVSIRCGTLVHRRYRDARPPGPPMCRVRLRPGTFICVEINSRAVIRGRPLRTFGRFQCRHGFHGHC
jgi:hypothetical protein